MLWYKAWLETRMRLLFLFAMSGIMLVLPSLGTRHPSLWQMLRMFSPMLGCLAAIMLAGAGINTQTVYRTTSGFHKSMFFTLSLPIPRRRLFSVRAGLGAIEACFFVGFFAVATLGTAPVSVSALQAIEFVSRVVICTLGVYALFAFLATFLDDMWRASVGVFGLIATLMLQSRYPHATAFNLLAGVSMSSNPLTAATPWAAVITSGVAIVVFACSSIFVLDRKEY
jgi:hypothetical protein